MAATSRVLSILVLFIAFLTPTEAQAQRVADGAEYVGDEHLEAALEELGIDMHRYDLPDAPTGAGV